ncbi:MAG: MBL fold metallo-hydrolase [Planctomycetota bacterium]|jgi:glyoxylase-like metal-dependent hydrolase (beta-lactamase superfamily II)|nr:MBL fold metallo-hydrolase [Planctomycetota bacterium]
MAEIIGMEVGSLTVCCYLVFSAPAQPDNPVPCVIIDPGGDAGKISECMKQRGLEPEAILLTHSHADHIGGVEEILAAWPGCKVICSEETSRRAGDPRLNLSSFIGEPFRISPASRFLGDGEEFTLAGLQWRAEPLPGHEPGEMVYVLNSGEALFCGDTVFAGSVGRSDFPGGDGVLLVEGIKRLLPLFLPATPLYPGHGPASTAGRELKTNPFLQGFPDF